MYTKQNIVPYDDAKFEGVPFSQFIYKPFGTKSIELQFFDFESWQSISACTGETKVRTKSETVIKRLINMINRNGHLYERARKGKPEPQTMLKAEENPQGLKIFGEMSFMHAKDIEFIATKVAEYYGVPNPYPDLESIYQAVNGHELKLKGNSFNSWV